MYGLTLEWPYCPDGVERFDYGRRKANQTRLGSRSAGPHYRYRNRQRLPFRHTLNLEDPIVLHFVNAREGQGLSEFFKRFGLLDDLSEEADERAVLGTQRTLRVALGMIDRVPAKEAIRRINLFLRDIRVTPSMEWGEDDAPRLALRPQTLLGFMHMEVATMAANGNQLASCAQCKKWWVTGRQTGRRSSAKYCADKCRVAAARKRAL